MNQSKKFYDPRSAAVEALELVFSGSHVQAALAEILKNFSLAPIDKQLCSDLLYGTLRTEIRIWHILGKMLAKPAKLPMRMRLVLAVAVYSLLFQEKIPAYAAIDSAVSQIKKIYGQKLASVANAVLRNVDRLKNELQEPEWYGANKAGERIFYSLPENIWELWKRSYGEAAALNLMRRSFQRPHTGLRVNMAHPDAKELLAILEKAPGAEKICPAGIALRPGFMPGSILGRETGWWQDNGAISFQSAGSQLIIRQLGLNECDFPVWDVCAGVGGKSAALIEGGGNVALASDITAKRLYQIGANCRRLNLKSPRIILADASAPPLQKWDGNILVDAPCSGLGVLARRPDIKRRPPRNLANVQKNILKGVCGLLQPGRKLAYITCTLDPAENEKVVDWITRTWPNLVLETSWQSPHDHPWLEGMFGAVFKARAFS